MASRGGKNGKRPGEIEELCSSQEVFPAADSEDCLRMAVGKKEKQGAPGLRKKKTLARSGKRRH